MRASVVVVQRLHVVGVNHLRVRHVPVISLVDVAGRIALARPVAIVPVTVLMLGSVIFIHAPAVRMRPIHVIVMVPAEFRLRSVTVVDVPVLLLARPVLVVALSVVGHVVAAAAAAPELVEAGVVTRAADGLDRREVASAVVAMAMAMAVIGEMAAVVLIVLVVLVVFVVYLVVFVVVAVPAVVKREGVGRHDIGPLIDLPRFFHNVVGVCVAVHYNL